MNRTSPAEAQAIATAAAPAPRFDLYGPIHKALRLMMADMLARAGSVDPADDADVEDTVARVRTALAMMLSHLEHENEFVHPALEARQPGSAARVAGEHEEHRASIEALSAEAAALPRLPAADRAAAAQRLYRHLGLFVAENLEHMVIEETRHNELLWSTCSDADLLAVHDAIVGHVAPDAMAAYMRWMAPALSHAELAGMLAGMQAGAPAEAFAAMLDITRANLDERRWHKLAVALGLPAVPGLMTAR